jgi:hypothetical protein
LTPSQQRKPSLARYSCGHHKPALDFDDVQNLGVKKGKKPKKEGPKRHQKRSTMVLLAQGKPKYAVYL